MRPSLHSLFFLFLILVALPCCTPDSYPTWMEGEPGPADLSITVNIPTPPPATKVEAGYWDGDDTGLASWGDWEKLVDGRQLYNVTLLIIRLRDNTLVAYRDFYMDGTLHDYCDDDDPNSATGYGLNGFWDEAGDALYENTVAYTTAVKATFDHAHPMHGSIEELATGAYRMLVVANYRPVSGVSSTGAVTPKSYSGMVDRTSSFTTEIGTLRSNFGATTGIPNFDATHYPAIFGHQLHAAKVNDVEQYICEQVPQPLTLVKDFFVRSGSNTISDAQLVRTYSRIRIKVANECEAKDLRIDGILFDAPFAQKSTSLFDFGDDTQFDQNLQGIPLVRSTHAIIPFVTGTTINRMTASQYNEAAIFDAYILESRRPDDLYGFKLQIHYDFDPNNDVQDLTPEGQYLLSNQPIQRVADFEHYLSLLGDGASFLLKQTRSNDFMFDTQSTGFTTSMQTANTTYMPIRFKATGNLPGSAGGSLGDYQRYIWRFYAASDGYYYIKNYLQVNSSDRYVGTMPGDRSSANRWIPLVESTYKARYKLINAPSADRILFQGDGDVTSSGDGRKNNLKYFNHNAGTDQYLKWYDSDTDEGSYFQLFPVLVGSAPYPITIQVIDQQTGQPQNLTEIRRNDYVTVHVSVIYHPTPYDLQFIVKPWGAENDESFQFD